MPHIYVAKFDHQWLDDGLLLVRHQAIILTRDEFSLITSFIIYEIALKDTLCSHFALGDELKIHDDVIKWKHFPRYWPFVRGIHRSQVNYPHKGQWHGALMFSLICVWIIGWVNNREAGDLRRYHAHYDVILMLCILQYEFRSLYQRHRMNITNTGVGTKWSPTCRWHFYLYFLE